MHPAHSTGAEQRGGPVLEAVLAEPDVVAADLGVVTGDHASGPQPVAVLDRLAALGDRVVFGGLPAEVRTVVCGHTHMAFSRLVDRRLVVNPGSIGMPYGRSGGHWALLHDGQVAMRRTAVDVDAVCARVVAASGFPGRQEWVDYFVRAAAGDAEALALFAPRDGRAPA